MLPLPKNKIVAISRGPLAVSERAFEVLAIGFVVKSQIRTSKINIMFSFHADHRVGKVNSVNNHELALVRSSTFDDIAKLSEKK